MSNNELDKLSREVQTLLDTTLGQKFTRVFTAGKQTPKIKEMYDSWASLKAKLPGELMYLSDNKKAVKLEKALQQLKNWENKLDALL